MENLENQTSFGIKLKQKEIKEINTNKRNNLFKVIHCQYGDNKMGMDVEINMRKNKILKGKKNFVNKKQKISDGINQEKKFCKKGEIFNVGRWSIQEHQKFFEGLLKYGNNWKKVQEYIGTRNSTQARSHAQKFFVKIGKTQIQKLDLDFENNSLRSLSLLINKLEGEQIASSLKSLNELVLGNRKDLTKFNQVNHDSSTESDSINLRVKNKKVIRKLNKKSTLTAINTFHNFSDSEKNFSSFDYKIQSKNSDFLTEQNINSKKDLVLPESPKIFNELHSNFKSSSNLNFSLQNENICNSSNNTYLSNGSHDKTNFLKFYLDNNIFSKIEVESKPILEETHFKLFFDERNFVNSDLEGHIFENQIYNEEVNLVSNSVNSMMLKENFSLFENEKAIQENVFSIFSSLT